MQFNGLFQPPVRVIYFNVTGATPVDGLHPDHLRLQYAFS